jgi:hypothetical protein
MNENSDEQKIRQWFREARRRDELRAPSFAAMLAAAQSSKPRDGWQLSARRIAFATMAVIAIGGAALFFFSRPAAQPDQAIAEHAHTFELTPGSTQPALPPIQPPRVVNAAFARSSSPYRKPHVARPRPEIETSALLSFKWQSPTDFLLRTPGADLLKTVPHLNDSRIRFNVILSDERN